MWNWFRLLRSVRRFARLPADRQVRVLFLDGHVETQLVEEYLRYVVPSEVYASWPKVVLKAFTLMARSYTYYAILHPRHKGADVCTSTHCQVYGSSTNPQTDQAIKETEGEYIAYIPSGDLPIEAVYSAACGGHTENNEDVWPGEPRGYLRRVNGCPCGRPRNGHGVGGCQWGLFEQNKREPTKCYCDLALFYYTDCVVVRPVEPPPEPPPTPSWCKMLEAAVQLVREINLWLRAMYEEYCSVCHTR